MKPVDAVAAEPMLVVCEGVQVIKCPDDQRSFVLRYSDSEMRLEAESEEELFKWMVKVRFVFEILNFLTYF